MSPRARTISEPGSPGSVPKILPSRSASTALAVSVRRAAAPTDCFLTLVPFWSPFGGRLGPDNCGDQRIKKQPSPSENSKFEKGTKTSADPLKHRLIGLLIRWSQVRILHDPPFALR